MKKTLCLLTAPLLLAGGANAVTVTWNTGDALFGATDAWDNGGTPYTAPADLSNALTDSYVISNGSTVTNGSGANASLQLAGGQTVSLSGNSTLSYTHGSNTAITFGHNSDAAGGGLSVAFGSTYSSSGNTFVSFRNSSVASISGSFSAYKFNMSGTSSFTLNEGADFTTRFMQSGSSNLFIIAGGSITITGTGGLNDGSAALIDFTGSTGFIDYTLELSNLNRELSGLGLGGTAVGAFDGTDNAAWTQIGTSGVWNSTLTNNVGGLDYGLRYDSNGTGSGSVSLVAVPEPSSTALLGLGGLALIMRRRK